MNKRKVTSGGQAIVMVTLSLFAMCGMMGLAVDSGWSYFVQKQAQAAADAGALAAVHEMYVRSNGTVSGVVCSINAECKTSLSPPALCSAIGTDSNLYTGCGYAVLSGFPNSKVNIVSNVGGAAASPPPPIYNIPPANIAYWATYRTFTNIPQLFSAMMGKTQATIAAKATAAVIAVVVPGSFLGMNHEKDCQTDSAGAAIECGVDMDIGGSGNGGQCKDFAGNNTTTASVCGPAGIFLASQCHGAGSPAGCSDGGKGGNNYAGQTGGNASAWAVVNKIQGSGWVNDPSKWTAAPVNGGGGTQFQDPTTGEKQPPIAPSLGSSTPITPCPVTSTTLPSTNLGPYQYYHVDNKGIPDGQQLSLSAGTTFSAGGSCPGGGVASNLASQSFPSYVFYGGLNMDSVNTTTGSTFGPGQYVMAGTTSLTGTVLTSTKGNFTGDSASGTMIILTDANYPTLTQPSDISTAISNGLTFYQGYTYFKNDSGSLTGININSDAKLAQYAGTLFWQDRNNTSLTASGHYDVNGNWVSGACTTATCGATNTSPNFELDHGNPSLTMTGVLYQPRGAWMTIQAGTGAISNSPLQVITGALVFTTGGGNANVVLLGPTLPSIKFRTSLIQ